MITPSSSAAPTAASAVVAAKLPVHLDTKGRLRVSQAQRRDILAALTRSGESLPRFAARTGLKYSTLARWVQHDRRRQPPGRKPAVRLLEAVVRPPAPAPALLVHLPGGARVELRAASQVPLMAALVRALEQPC